MQGKGKGRSVSKFGYERKPLEFGGLGGGWFRFRVVAKERGTAIILGS